MVPSYLKKKKVGVFSDQCQCFLLILFLVPRAAEKSEWQYWQDAEDLETEDSTMPGLWFVCWQELLLPHVFSTFSISSILFHFVQWK